MNIWVAILDLFFPPRCAVCARVIDPGGTGICDKCRDKLAALTDDGDPPRGDYFDVCHAPLRYDGAVRDAILRYKFEGARDAAPALGRILARCVAERLNGAFDVITWAPVSRKRLRERGYDQARLLAECAAGELGLAAVPLLEKHRHVPAQSTLNGAAARRGNVADAYAPLPGADIAGRRVLLIDDVVTTGATLSECARALLLSGAEGVVCAALARTPTRGENA
jgi:ComF family protein